MRLFVALDLPADLRRELVARAAGLAAELPPARWVRADALHLTLAFLGELVEARVAPLRRDLAPAFAGAAPLTLRAAGAGTFPPERPARVAWVGLEAPPALARLRRAVAAAAAGYAERALDRRPFHPHLTLARCRRPWPPAAARRWREGFAAARWAPFEAREGVLYESRLAPGGAAYRAVERFPMEAAA